MALGVGLSISETKKSVEYSEAEEEVNFLLVDVYRVNEESDEEEQMFHSEKFIVACVVLAGMGENFLGVPSDINIVSTRAL